MSDADMGKLSDFGPAHTVREALGYCHMGTTSNRSFMIVSN